jgi:hypothetical protein
MPSSTPAQKRHNKSNQSVFKTYAYLMLVCLERDMKRLPAGISTDTTFFVLTFPMPAQAEH